MKNQNWMAPLDAASKGLVWLAYADNCGHEEIEEEGYNENEGCYYLVLENGVTIGSTLGQRVEFSVIDLKYDREASYYEYQEALNHSEEIMERE
jgi:hypothetical protein